MKKIILSICIPTFNREKSVYRLVTDILKIEDQSIEVVVLDNGSTDNTIKVLSEIKDPRFHIFTNGENKGALFNMVNVLDKGQGDFVVYSTDQDYIDNTKIDDFKSFLMNTQNLSCGFCSLQKEDNIKNEIFDKGFEAIKHIAYKGNHPTGHFFKKSLLKKIGFPVRFSDYNMVNLFPLEFVFAELCILGKAAIYKKHVFIPETGESVVTHKSSTTNGSLKSAFFSPESRLKLLINYVSHINSLDISNNEKAKLIRLNYIQGLLNSTLGYRSILLNEKLCIHYTMETRVVSNFELLSIAVNFYKNFIKGVQKLLNLKKIVYLIFSMNILFLSFYLFLKQFLIRIFHFSLKLLFKIKKVIITGKEIE